MQGCSPRLALVRFPLRGRASFAAVLLFLLLGLALSGCRRAAFSLLPPAPMGPERTTDPFAPLSPSPGNGAAEKSSTSVTAAGGTADLGVSGAALLGHLLSGGGFFLGIYGTFEENDLVVSPKRKPAPSGAAPGEASPSPPASAAPRPEQPPR